MDGFDSWDGFLKSGFEPAGDGCLRLGSAGGECCVVRAGDGLEVSFVAYGRDGSQVCDVKSDFPCHVSSFTYWAALFVRRVFKTRQVFERILSRIRDPLPEDLTALIEYGFDNEDELPPLEDGVQRNEALESSSVTSSLDMEEVPESKTSGLSVNGCLEYLRRVVQDEIVACWEVVQGASSSRNLEKSMSALSRIESLKALNQKIEEIDGEWKGLMPRELETDSRESSVETTVESDSVESTVSPCHEDSKGFYKEVPSLFDDLDLFTSASPEDKTSVPEEIEYEAECRPISEDDHKDDGRTGVGPSGGVDLVRVFRSLPNLEAYQRNVLEIILEELEEAERLKLSSEIIGLRDFPVYDQDSAYAFLESLSEGQRETLIVDMERDLPSSARVRILDSELDDTIRDSVPQSPPERKAAEKRNRAEGKVSRHRTSARKCVSNFKVIFPSGNKIAADDIADTFVDSIEWLGPARVAALNETVCGDPLLTQDKSQIHSMRKLVRVLEGGWFLKMQMKPSVMADVIERCALRLGTDVCVERLYRDQIDKHRNKSHHQEKKVGDVLVPTQGMLFDQSLLIPAQEEKLVQASSIRSRLNHEMLGHGITTRILARATSVDVGTIRQWRRGRGCLTQRQYEDACKCIGCDLK